MSKNQINEELRAFKKFCEVISNNPQFLEKGVSHEALMGVMDETLKDYSVPTRQIFGLDVDDIEKYYLWGTFSSSVYVLKITDSFPKELSKEKEKILSMYNEPIEVIKKRRYSERLVFDTCEETFREETAEHKIDLANDIAHIKSLTNLPDGFFEDVVTNLQRDANPKVRAAIARQGYFDLLQNDTFWSVREAIADYKMGKDFPALKHSKDKGMDI